MTSRGGSNNANLPFETDLPAGLQIIRPTLASRPAICYAASPIGNGCDRPSFEESLLSPDVSSSNYELRPLRSEGEDDVVEQMIEQILRRVVNGAVEAVELARLTEAAVLCVRRRHGASAGAVAYPFWAEAARIAAGLFDACEHRHAELLLCACCAVGVTPVRHVGGAPSSQDLTCRALALDLLRHFLERSGRLFRESPFWGYQVRRLAITVLLHNVELALATPSRLLPRLLGLLSALWRHFRQWCKVHPFLLASCLFCVIARLRHRKVV